MGRTVDVRGDVNLFFNEGGRGRLSTLNRYIPSSLVSTDWVYVTAQVGDEVLYGCNALSML